MISKFNHLFLFLFILIQIISCKEDSNEDLNKPPVILEQEFSIVENSVEGTIVDTVEIETTSEQNNYTFQIIGGDLLDVFKITKTTGIIAVNNSAFLDYEKQKEFELLIEVTTNTSPSLVTAKTIKIDVLDIQPTTEGLISFYDFQGNSKDAKGGIDGIEKNIEYFTENNETENKIARLKGNDSYVEFEDPFDLESKTISLWFNVMEADDNLNIILSTDNPNLKYGLSILSVQQINSETHLNFNFSNQIESIKILDDTWYNATLVLDQKNYQYYLNGDLIKEGSFNSYYSSINGSPNTILGSDRTKSDRFFDGLIDDLRIYNRDLSEEEIKVIYSE